MAHPAFLVPNSWFHCAVPTTCTPFPEVWLFYLCHRAFSQMNVKHLTTRPGLSWCTMSDLICLKVKIKSSPRLSLASRGQWHLLILIYCDKLLSFSHTRMQYWKQAKRAALATAWLKVKRLVFSERSPPPPEPCSLSLLHSAHGGNSDTGAQLHLFCFKSACSMWYTHTWVPFRFTYATAAFRAVYGGEKDAL